MNHKLRTPAHTSHAVRACLALVLLAGGSLAVACSEGPPATLATNDAPVPGTPSANTATDASPAASDSSATNDATVGDTAAPLFDAGADARGPSCSPSCGGGKSCTYAGTCVATSTCNPADVGVSCPAGVVGSWVINGNNKINKLENVILCVEKNVSVQVYDAQRKPVLSISDIFCKQTNFNDLLPKGIYFLEFYDGQGGYIPVPEYLQEDLDLK